jgi:hypothetical protein
MKLTAPVLLACAVVLSACTVDSPVPTDHGMHAHGLSLSTLQTSTNAKTLADLKQFSVKFHDLDVAVDSGFGLLKLPPATAPDGCISSRAEGEGGMGYHYTRGTNILDDSIGLLDPEFLVYAPKSGPLKDGEARTRLAAFEYFLPFTPRWPAPGQPGFQAAPTLHDFSTTQGLPDVAFVPTERFGGWMLHIWLWENNPAGEFANWNASVPLCNGSTF